MSATENDAVAARFGAAASPHHAVQFYEGEEFLFACVADFVAGGIVSGEKVIVIATKSHRDGFAERLRTKGFDVDDLSVTGRVTFVDAREALSAFMNGRLPDERRFLAHIGGLFQSATEGRTRAYGEMVDLLWRDGDVEAAIRLEELWNDLAQYHTFSLLCAYPIGNFNKETDEGPFQEVCALHQHVFPAESLSDAITDDAKAREIALLQRRAATLEAEIAQRKELEQALRESLSARRQAERQLNDFVENAPLGLHWVGPDGTILWANDAELKLLGYERDQYVGRKIHEFHADVATIKDILDRLARGEEIRDYEARVVASDGTIKHVSLTSNVLFDKGRFVHTRCFTRDITDRKRLEEQNAFLLDATAILTGSLDYESRLTELAKLAVPRLADWCAVDVARPDGSYDRMGLEHADPERAGIPRDMCIGWKSLREGDPISRVIATGESHVVSDVSDEDLASLAREAEHLPFLRSLGIRSWLIVPMRVGARSVGAITLVSAESGRRYSADDLSLAIELARRAATAIENARLYGLAQQANRSKDEFLATLSHELRTPLTAILGWARMLSLGGLDDDTTQTAVATIERSARAQATLIDDLLDLSKIVTGKITLRTELVDLGSVVDTAVQTIRLAAEAKHIAIDLIASTDRLVVKGDPTRLQQIVWNLLSNSVKFSDPGRNISVAVRRDRSAAAITVSDRGRGITPEFLPHVFEPFRQADGATTRSHGGLGLGLAIVKYLAELHGGSVSAQSAGEGDGATFVVTLPLALDRSMPAGAKSQEMADLNGTSVLLVDDDPDTRLVVGTILRRCGAEVDIAASVPEACQMLLQHTPTMVITDIAMPVHDGFSLLEFVRTKGNGLSQIPVLALTAFGHAEAEERLRAAGFDAHMKKPVDPIPFARIVAGFARG